MMLTGYILGIAMAANAPSAAQLLEKMQAVYRNSGDMTANFTQTYTDKLRGKSRVESGEVWAKTDGRVRWSYSSPVHKDFVFDGQSAYFYEPDNAQVTVFEQFRDSQAYQALRFLWGQGQLDKHFIASNCDKESCGEIPAKTAGLKLVPKTPLASVKYAVLIMDAAKYQVVQSILFDPLGNRTVYAFSSVKFGTKVEDNKFRFTPPAGVNILKGGE